MPEPCAAPAVALTVALSVFNGARYLAEAIESVLAQTFTDFEFLIVDDGSTDATRAIIEHYAARDRRIRPILRDNRGLVVSLNQLLAEARGAIVARMDADDRCDPERFARQLAFLAAHPDHGVVGCGTRHIDAQGRECGSEGPDHPLDHEAVLRAMDAGQTPLAHPAVMYRRDLVRAAGGYHAAFRHCEDLDLWLRLSDRTRIANLPERLIAYRRHEGQVSNRHALEQQIGAAISRAVWRERQQGRPDPTEQLGALPPIAALDGLFARPGVSRAVRAEVLSGLLYSTACANEAGLALIADHLRDGGSREGLWRMVARWVRLGEPVWASRLVALLVRSGGATNEDRARATAA